MSGLLASPRRRRRLLWAGGLLTAAGVIAIVAVALPSSGPPRQTRTNEGPLPFTTTSSPAEQAARDRAERDVRSLAHDFLPNASFTIAYSDPDLVGIVAQDGNTLVALIYRKANGKWQRTYEHQGEASRYTTAANYAPPGFIPGSHTETIGTWLLLALILVGSIAIVAFVDWWLGRRRSRNY